MTEREIFLEAFEMSTPEARAAYLQGACRGDVTLRRNVDELLKEHFSNDSLLARPVLEGEGTEVESSAEQAPATVLGRYKLLEKIGEGGFGEVWMAEQREPIKRRVALKIIKLGMDSRQIVARFEAERQALAMMDHPNIAKIFDAGTTGQESGVRGQESADAKAGSSLSPDSRLLPPAPGRPYFVMELVRGIKITEYCDENHLPTQERLKLFILVCQAIQHAHQKGVIHRDIKPSNILVTLHDGVPVPKVIDFGIAKATQQDLTDKTVFTQFQQFIGTPAYISPEQAEMSGLDIDTRADIYSLGVLLYELLVGQTPFDAMEMMKNGIDALRQIIREREPLRPSTKLNTLPGEARTTAAKRRQTDVGKLVHQLQGDLDWIVMKCLEKDRTRRYETANGLASDIQRHLSNEAVLARPPSAAYRFQKLVRRNKLAFAAVTSVAVVLVLGIVVSAWQAIRATRSEQNEAQLRVRAEAQELAARRRSYASDINLAQQALAFNNLGRARELLYRQRPESSTLNSQLSTDSRGWEWRYLWRQCQSDALYTLCQETNQIGSLSVSADGKLMVVAGDRSDELSIWDLQTRRTIVNLPAGKGQVRAVFSPQDSLLAFSVASRQSSTNWQYGIRLWNSETREIVAELPLPSNCLCLAFSSDGRTLVTLTKGTPGQITLWQIRERKKLASYPALQNWHLADNSFAVASDMSVAAYRMKRNVQVIDLASGQERWTAEASEQEHIQALALSSDGKLLASGTGFTESTIRLWDVASKREINRLQGHRSYVGTLLFWPDGKTLASGSGDQTIRLWDLSNPANVPPPRVLRGHKDEIFQFTLLPDQTTLVSGCKDGSVCFWDTTSTRQPSTRITVPGTFSSWRFDPESKSVVTLAHNGNVARRRSPSFQGIETLLDIGTNFVPGRTLISPDTRLLAAGSEQSRLRVWDLRRGVLLGEWTNGIAPEPFAFLADAKRLLTVDRGDGVHREWDLTTFQETQSWRGAAGLSWTCRPTISPDERWCLTLNAGGSGLLRDMTTGSERNLNLNLDEVSSAAFSPNGMLFAATSGFGSASLRETATFHATATFRGTLQGVHSVAFSPDGKRLAIGSDGIEAIKIWDRESRQELLTLEGQGSVFHRTAFSPDGDVLGSMNGEGRLHFWRAPSWEEIAEAEAQEKTESKKP